MPGKITPLLVDTDSLTESGYSILPLFSVLQHDSGWLDNNVWQVGDWVCTCHRGAACTSPGKHPMATDGVKSATPFVDVARRNFRRAYRKSDSPPAINVGIATGNTHGSRNLVVLDIDPRNDGLDSVYAIEKRFGFTGMLIHPTVYTGGGGYHLYFRATDQPLTQLDEHLHIFRSRSNLAGYRGIDLKADGGYVVAPPSTHVSGLQYTWNPDNYPSPVPHLRKLPIVPHFLLELSEEDCSTHTHGTPYDSSAVNMSVVSELLSIKAIKRRYDRHHGKLRDQTQSGVDYSLACLCATHVAASGADIAYIVQRSREEAGLPDGKSRNYVKHTVAKALGFAETLRDEDRVIAQRCNEALSSTTSAEMKAAFNKRRRGR